MAVPTRTGEAPPLYPRSRDRPVRRCNASGFVLRILLREGTYQLMQERIIPVRTLLNETQWIPHVPPIRPPAGKVDTLSHLVDPRAKLSRNLGTDTRLDVLVLGTASLCGDF